MGQTITFRPTKKLAAWIDEVSKRTGLSQGQIIRTQLEQARSGDARKFMRLAGIIRGGPRDLSTRKGFSKQ
jgi:hypothetical protein